MRSPFSSRRRLRLAAIGALGGAASLVVIALAMLDHHHPVDLSRAQMLGRVLYDRHGQPLRYRLAADERLRLPAEVDAVDPLFLHMLVAYEDKRFYRHAGVDPLATMRALGQWIRNGRVVSGASTLTMQTARLLETRPRTLGAKLAEMGRALQLERALSKQEILSLYLRLAPYGGNVEGIAAASQRWFGHGPEQLTPAEAALLVALPQSPTRLRPDRHPQAGLEARAKVLRRVWRRLAEQDLLAGEDLRLALSEPLSKAVADPLPVLAPHLADRLLAVGEASEINSCLDADLQERVRDIARVAVRQVHPRANVAVLVVDNDSAQVHAYLGGTHYFSALRAGQVDLTRATRSPGSTLKPFIYGLAFDRGLAAPATRVMDRPTRFGKYAPANFEQRYYGALELADALRLSLNVPAVALLDALGPTRFTMALEAQGVPLALPSLDRPGLAIALGGAGTTLEALVRLYRGLADDGETRPLQLLCENDRAGEVQRSVTPPLLQARARWQLQRILRTAAGPGARGVAAKARIAFKTGTSYGHRDAWAIGFDARWTVGVWVGRPDGTPLPGIYGHGVAAPILFEVFDALPAAEESSPTQPPAGALASFDGQRLPPMLRFLGEEDGVGGGPRVLFPLPETKILLGATPLRLESTGGEPPFTWLVDGAPMSPTPWPSQQWQPSGPGFFQLTVVDARGRADRVNVQLSQSAAPTAGRLKSALERRGREESDAPAAAGQGHR
ncbi:MAG: penicillin-binding protein 1C [Pseudomonadota bacterium]